MQLIKVRTLLAVAVLVPAVGGALATGCDDGDDVVVNFDGGVDASGGVGGTGGVAGAGGVGGAGGGNIDGGSNTDGAAGAGGTGGVAACSTTPVSVSADIMTDTNWPCGVYVLRKRVFVQNNAKLTVAAGSQVLGDPAATPDKASLIVTRGSQLIAKGTATAPIVFSSNAATGMRKGGDWGGLALLGSAKINTGTPCTGVAGCTENRIEGLPLTENRAFFGGIDDAGSCGELQYVRIEFAGAELEPGRELNGLTLGGCGAGTKLSYIQVHRGTDDGIEFFGGTASMDHVILTGNEDDSLDWDFGWTGKVQFLLVHQRTGIGDYGFEAAGSPQGESLAPRSAPTIYNATMLGRPDGGRAMHLKEGTRGIMRNLIVQGWNGDVIRFTAKQVNLTTEWPANLAIENSLFWMNGNYGTEVAGMASDDDMGFPDQMSVEDPARMNKKDVNPMVTPGTDLTTAAVPNYVPTGDVATGAATPPAGFDATATFKGAFKPGVAAWTAGWTAYPTN